MRHRNCNEKRVFPGAPRPTPAEAIQRYARATGVAMLLSSNFGALGGAYLPGKIIVAGAAAATATNRVAGT